MTGLRMSARLAMSDGFGGVIHPRNAFMLPVSEALVDPLL